MLSVSALPVPAHVRPDQVFEFDIYNDPGLLEDLHLGYHSLQQRAPEIFYTPLNGGHWMVTRYDLAEQILLNPGVFSNKELEIPKTESPFLGIPINLDPPEHTPYRLMLMRQFTPRRINELDGAIRHWAQTLIDRVADKGECEFLESLGALFPVTVFMEFAGLPLDRYVEFREVVTEFFSHIPKERRIELQGWIFNELEQVFRARMAEPQEDLFSRLAAETIDGRSLTMDELLAIGFLLFVAGLDTVANGLTFSFNFLAANPEMQDLLREHPERIGDYIEESMRRFPVTNGVRLVAQDFELAGASLKAGDMIVAPMSIAGLDDRRNPDPLRHRSQAPSAHKLFHRAAPLPGPSPGPHRDAYLHRGIPEAHSAFPPCARISAALARRSCHGPGRVADRMGSG